MKRTWRMTLLPGTLLMALLWAGPVLGQSIPSCDSCDRFATACFMQCVECLPPYTPDGYCVGGVRYTTCEEIWGCCPDWDVSRTLIGRFQRGIPPIFCTYHLVWEYHIIDRNRCFPAERRCDEELDGGGVGIDCCDAWGCGGQRCGD